MRNDNIRAIIHTKHIGRNNIHTIFYGENPIGPRGGRNGQAINAKQVIGWYASTTYSPSIWILRVAAYLNTHQPDVNTLNIHHTFGRSDVKINGVNV